jgi:hypothetical protein
MTHLPAICMQFPGGCFVDVWMPHRVVVIGLMDPQGRFGMVRL